MGSRKAATASREIGKFELGSQLFFEHCRSSLSPDRQVLFDRYELINIAVKVPGSG